MGKKPILTVFKAEGHSADTGAGKFPLVSMGGWAKGLACADPGARNPIGTSQNSPDLSLLFHLLKIYNNSVFIFCLVQIDKIIIHGPSSICTNHQALCCQNTVCSLLFGYQGYQSFINDWIENVYKIFMLLPTSPLILISMLYPYMILMKYSRSSTKLYSSYFF